jgi:hypothetical protein
MMSRFDDTEDPRRRRLLQALAAGVFAGGVPMGEAQASFLGDRPTLMHGHSIYQIEGKVLVNGHIANKNTYISPNATVETGPDSHIIFVVGKDAYILRANSKLVLAAQPQEPTIAHTLRLLAGAILSVFGKGPHQVQTDTAVVGIRGTGVYTETNPDLTYFCTCYGTVDMRSNTDPSSRATIVSQHHNAPKYISAKGTEGKLIRPAPFKDHTDMELMLIEALVGRTPPFVFPMDEYQGPRRDY